MDYSKLSTAQLLEVIKGLESKRTAGKAQFISFKVSQGGTVNPKTGKTSKGGKVSVYGLQRFPVTLSEDQWKRLLIERREDLLKFMADNASKLTHGDDDEEATPAPAKTVAELEAELALLRKQAAA